MAHIVDHRGKSSSPENRERYMTKEKEKIKRAVRHYVDKTNIQDLAGGKDIGINVNKKSSGLDEDDDAIDFLHTSGSTDTIFVNNDEYDIGWSKKMPDGEEGMGREGSEDGSDDEVDFKFHLTAKEFMDLLFEELCLPFFVKKTLEETDSNTFHKAGFVSDGSPARLNVIRTYKNSIARASAELADYTKQLAEEDDEEKKTALEEKIKNIPLFRDVDLRFSNMVPDPIHQSKGVMFCLMDVSGSMTEGHRRVAKQFFLILYIFLKKCYTTVDIVFILHADSAREVTEEEFFHSSETGGTKMSTALEVMDGIIKERYNLEVYNIYAAHMCDGGNFSPDNSVYTQKIKELLSLVQYFIHADIVLPGEETWYDGALRNKLELLAQTRQNITSVILHTHQEIWEAFVDLFKKKGTLNQYE